MASSGLRKELECSICPNLYTDPVTLSCGHNFCRVCIDQVLNTQNQSGDYSCPECRAEFQERPVLQTNIDLCSIVENFLSAPRDHAVVFCTYCVHSPVPAVKSCLHCEVSLCKKHLTVHSKGPEHVLTDPSTNLEKRKCSVHKKILEYYCTEDAAFICVTCSLAGEHRGHQVEMLDEASETKKKKLRNVLQKLITKREETEERIQSLEEHWRKTQEKASRESERVIALLIDMRRPVDDLEKRVLGEICRQMEELSRSFCDVIQNLEIKKDELSRKMRHIEELCNMTDPLTVLQDPDTGDLCDPEERGGDMDTDDLCDPEEWGWDENIGEHNGIDWGEKLILNTLHTLADIMRGVNVTFYIQGPADISLDINTADNNILISDDLKTATWTEIKQNRPETVTRFQDWPQVMSSSRFTSGRRYWDVDFWRSKVWLVGMCYPSINRRRTQSFAVDNARSWCLYSGENVVYMGIHGGKSICLPHKISGARVRVYLDYEAGQLSFYELCDPIRHLHTFTATFTEPLCAILYVGGGSIRILGE